MSPAAKKKRACAGRPQRDVDVLARDLETLRRKVLRMGRVLERLEALADMQARDP